MSENYSPAHYSPQLRNSAALYISRAYIMDALLCEQEGAAIVGGVLYILYRQ
jgi:hypothetical protein